MVPCGDYVMVSIEVLLDDFFRLAETQKHSPQTALGCSSFSLPAK